MTKSHLLRFLMLLAVLAIVFGGGLLPRAGAADWQDPVGGDFDDETKWVGGVVPGDTDDAIFNTGGAYDVLFNGDQTTATLQIVNGDVRLQSAVDPDNPGIIHNYTLDTGVTLGTLLGDSGILRISDLNVDTNGGMEILGGSGLFLQAGGTLSVTGTLNAADGSLELNGGRLTVGELIIDEDNGAFINFIGGTLDITGLTGLTIGLNGTLGSDLLFAVGDGQTINITETTTVEDGTTLRINGGEFTTGALDLSGGGELDFAAGTLGFTGPELEIGAGGPLGAGFTLGPGRTLNVSNETRVPGGESLNIDGGDFTTNTLVFDGPGAGINLVSGTASFNNLFTRNGSEVVFGAGNNFIVPGEIIIGEDGTGSTLLIEDGGTVESADGAIGDLLGADGEVIVRGVGSRWTMTDNGAKFQIGNNGDGTVRVLEGGEIFADGANIGDETTSTGTLIVDGPGSLYGKSSDPSKNVDVGFRGTGSLTITNEGRVEAMGHVVGKAAGTENSD